MRLSIPTIPVRQTASSPNAPVRHISADEAAAKLARWLRRRQRQDGRTLILTGAGVSVDSGIRAYRGEKGAYTIRKSTYRPIFYQEFIESAAARRRYWARSYLGYPPVQHARPNRTHFAISALQASGWAGEMITQNVDRLHHKASLDQKAAERDILELHGALNKIVCFSCQATFPRSPFQTHLSELNPVWAEFAEKLERRLIEPKLNPDGDVDLEGRTYDDFKVPNCYKCGKNSIRPNVVMFGQNLAVADKQRSLDMVDRAGSMLVIGSSLATYSAFRLLKSAADLGMPLCLINVGPSRGDEILPPSMGLDEDDPDRLRLDMPSTDVLTRTAALCVRGKVCS